MPQPNREKAQCSEYDLHLFHVQSLTSVRGPANLLIPQIFCAASGVTCRSFAPRPSANYWRTGAPLTMGCVPQFLSFMTSSDGSHIVISRRNVLAIPCKAPP